jgi:hypothetical protein
VMQTASAMSTPAAWALARAGPIREAVYNPCAPTPPGAKAKIRCRCPSFNSVDGLVSLSAAGI